MYEKGGYIFRPLFGAAGDSDREKAKAFWTSQGILLDEGVIKVREKQLLLAVENSHGEMVGVSTASKMRLKLLNNSYLYQFRHYLISAISSRSLRTRLLQESLVILESSVRVDPTPCIGAFTMPGRLMLSDNFWRRASWPETGFTFAGYDQKGNPLWVKYFDGVTI